MPLSEAKILEIQQCSELHPEWGGVLLSRACGVSKDAANKYRSVDRLLIDTPTPKVDRIEEFAEFHKEKFSELKDRFNKWIGNTGKLTKPPKKSAGKHVRAFVINDVHAPFHREDVLAKAIHQNRDCDECWVVGDLLDLFTFSRYEKYARPFSPVEEFQSGQIIINKLAETFPIVRVMSGNHDERFLKYLVRDKHLEPDIIEFLRFRYPNFTSPLANMCEGIENVVMMEPKKLDYASYGFLHQIGDCVLSHAERYSKVPAKTVSDVIEALKKKLEPMGVVKNFRVVAHAHTHTAAKVWGDYDVVGLELGCMSKTPDYDGSPRMMGRKPIIGYSIIQQDSGKTDINGSNFIQVE